MEPIHPFDVSEILANCSVAEIETFAKEVNPSDPGIVNLKGQLYRQTTLAPIGCYAANNSLVSQTRSVIPAAIAGVTRNDECTRTKLFALVFGGGGILFSLLFRPSDFFRRLAKRLL